MSSRFVDGDMVDRPRLRKSISYGGGLAVVLAWLPSDPTGMTFVFAFPVLTVVCAAGLYWTGWFVAE